MATMDDYKSIEYLLNLTENEDITGLIDFVQHCEKDGLLTIAVEALGKAKAEEAIGVLLFQALKGYAKVRHVAVVALGDIGTPSVVPPLIMLLRSLDDVQEGDAPQTDDYLGEPILLSLGKIAAKGSKEAMRSVIQALDSRWNEAALRALKGIGEPAVTLLVEALDSEDETMRKEAIRALGKIGSKSSTGALLAALWKTYPCDLDMTEEIVLALGMIRDQAATGALLRILHPKTSVNDGDYRLQNLLVTALGEIADKRATGALVNMLANGEIGVRMTAATALGMIRDDNAIVPLVGVIENVREEDVVRKSAAWALAQLDEKQVALPTGTDAEACAYLNTASLTASMDGYWSQIYLYVAGKTYTRWQKSEMPDDIRVDSLTDQQIADRNRLKEWLYRRRTIARQDAERNERRQLKEE